MEAPATQLADTRPRVDNPLRVVIPVNVPERNSKISRDEFIRNKCYTPFAHSLAEMNRAMIFHSKEDINNNFSNHRKKKLPEEMIKMDHDALNKNSISDFTLLAQSSHRANKKDVEATAYASIAVIYDNQLNYFQAIEFYEKYLNICQELEDLSGQASANNCIGVNYMLIACPTSDNGTFQNFELNEKSLAYLEKAMFYHKNHLSIGPDQGGKFVANSNIGLCLSMMGDINQAAKFHQDALRIAIKMQTLYGQSLSVGNLGLLALVKQDFVTSRTCFEQHLQLVQALFDPEAEINGWKMLANLASTQENYNDALDCLEQAMKIAEKENFPNELRKIHCLIGITKGTLELYNINSIVKA